MLHAIPVRIPSGDGAAITISWHDSENAPATPTAVRYQVFDARTSLAVSEVQDIVEDMASTMTLFVPAVALPVGERSTRNLVVQIEAEFNTDQHTAFAYVDVVKTFAFSEA